MYHYEVTIKLGCGCLIVNKLGIVDEPKPGDSFMALAETIGTPEVAYIMGGCEHEGKGEEKIDAKVRVKVGPIPEFSDPDSG